MKTAATHQAVVTKEGGRGGVYYGNKKTSTWYYGGT